MRKFTFFLAMLVAMVTTSMAQSYELTETRLTSSDLNSKTEPTLIAIKNLSATNNYWFVGNTGAAPYSAAEFSEDAVFVWEPVAPGVPGVAYCLKKLDGTYMTTVSPAEFSAESGAAAIFTTTSPTVANGGFNGDGDSMPYIDDEALLVRFVNATGTWINVQNGDAGTPVYNNGTGGWTIHNVYLVEEKEETVEPEPEPEPTVQTFAVEAALFPEPQGDVTEIKGFRVEANQGPSLSDFPTGWTLTNEAGNEYEMQFQWLYDWETVLIMVNPAITEAGTYTLTIPAGSLKTDDGKECEAATFSWTIEATVVEPEPEPEVVPAANKSYTVVAEGHSKGNSPQWAINDEGTKFVSSGDNVISTEEQKQFAFVAYEENTYLYSVSAKKFVMKDASLSDATPDAIEIVKLDNGKFFFRFDANHNINIGGSEQMIIDNWNIVDGGNQYTLNAVADFDATEALELLAPVEPELPALEITGYTPTEAVESLETITITFNDEIEGTFEMMAMSQIYLGSKSNGCSFAVEGNVLTITPFNAITTPGEYGLVIPEGLITRKANGEAIALNGEITFTVAEAAPVVDYTPTYTGAKTRNDRNMIAVTLDANRYELTSTEQNSCYVDVTETVTFTVAAGATVQAAIETGASWIHSFVFIDTDANGFTAGIEEGSDYAPTGDLMAYSFYNNDSTSDEYGWNSIGDGITGDNRNKPAVPAFTAPTQPGVYRMRFKLDWCSIDPMGDSDGKFGDFMGNGGQIIDVMLEVVEAEPELPALEITGYTPTEAVESLETITITFNDEIEGTFEMMAMSQIYLGSKSNGCSFAVEGNVLTITPFNAITTPGEYALVIPAGLITRKANGEAIALNGEITFTVKEATVEPEPTVPVVITSVDQLSNSKLYTITSSDAGRGNFYALDSKVDMCAVTYSAGADACHKVAYNAEDPKQQFAFVEYEGKHYLYSVSEKKFVAKNGNVNKLTAEAPFEFVVVESVSENTFALMLNGTHYMTASPGWCSNAERNTCIQTTLTDHNSDNGWDNGAWFTITEVGEFDATEAIAMLTPAEPEVEPLEVVSISPADGETVEKLEQIVVTFNAPVTLDETKNINLVAAEITPIEAYAGKWEVTSSWPGYPEYDYSEIGTIEVVDYAGVPALLCTGFSGYNYMGYDDSFLMMYNSEDGTVSLESQQLGEYDYYGTVCESILACGNTVEGVVFAGSLVGRIENGNIVFESAADNKYVADSWMFYAIDLNKGISYFNSLVWTPAAQAAAPAKAALRNNFKVEFAENLSVAAFAKSKVNRADENVASIVSAAINPDDATQLIITVNEELANGAYDLIIEEGAVVTAEGAANAAIKCRYYVEVPTGIEGIDAEVEQTIYDLTGRKIETITKGGIYIVNGKKVLVK